MQGFLAVSLRCPNAFWVDSAFQRPRDVRSEFRQAV